MKQDPTRLLRTALRANAVFSLSCGLVLAGGAFTLGPLLGVPAPALLVVGGVLVPFAVQLWLGARRPSISRPEAWTAVALDLCWVLGSAALILFELWPLTEAGRWAVIGVAEVVLLWAVLQALGLVRAEAHGAATQVN
jgi:hypothetical protein